MKGRASVSFVRDELDVLSKKRNQFNVIDERIDALNDQIKKKALTLKDGSLLIAVEQLKADFEKEASRSLKQKPLSDFNQEILESYIKNEIRVKTANKYSSTLTEVGLANRAIKLLENQSLRTLSVKVIQNILNSQTSEATNRNLLRVYRQLLKFVGRREIGEELRRKKYGTARPAYLTPDQILELSTGVPAALLVEYPLIPEFIRVTYNLGTRIGETLGLSKEDVVPTKNKRFLVKIRRQLLQPSKMAEGEKRLRLPKGDKVRDTLPINREQTLKDLKLILTELPKPEDREGYRRTLQKYIKDFCIENFVMGTEDLESSEDSDPDDFFGMNAEASDNDDERRYKAVHMLRASYVVEMLRISQGNYYAVANNIGDSPEVLRKHYGGEINTASIMQSLADQIDLQYGAKKKA